MRRSLMLLLALLSVRYLHWRNYNDGFAAANKAEMQWQKRMWRLA